MEQGGGVLFMIVFCGGGDIIAKVGCSQIFSFTRQNISSVFPKKKRNKKPKEEKKKILQKHPRKKQKQSSQRKIERENPHPPHPQHSTAQREEGGWGVGRER